MPGGFREEPVEEHGEVEVLRCCQNYRYCKCYERGKPEVVGYENGNVKIKSPEKKHGDK